MCQNKETSIIGFVAYSGTGKTSLLEKLIPLFIQNQISISLIKHAHHNFDIDQPEKDSYRLRKAGAVETIVASKNRWALIHENNNDKSEPNLWELTDKLDQSAIDLILVEGFKHEAYPKIELVRGIEAANHVTQDQHTIAIATDDKSGIQTTLPLLDINNPNEICDFILEFIDKK